MTIPLTPERIEEIRKRLAEYHSACDVDRYNDNVLRDIECASVGWCADLLSAYDALSRDVGRREALVKLVNAKALSGVRELVAGWNGEGKPDGPYGKHPPKLGAHIPTNCGAIYELDEAMTAARAALSPDAPRQKVEE